MRRRSGSLHRVCMEKRMSLVRSERGSLLDDNTFVSDNARESQWWRRLDNCPNGLEMDVSMSMIDANQRTTIRETITIEESRHISMGNSVTERYHLSSIGSFSSMSPSIDYTNRRPNLFTKGSGQNRNRDIGLSEDTTQSRRPFFKSNPAFNSNRKRSSYTGAIMYDKSEPAEFFPSNTHHSFAGNSEKSISRRRISHEDFMTDRDIDNQEIDLSEDTLQPRRPLFKSNAAFNNNKKKSLYAGAISYDQSEPADFFPPNAHHSYAGNSEKSISKRRISHEDFIRDGDIDNQDVDLSEDTLQPRRPLFKSNAAFKNDKKRSSYAGAISYDESDPAEFLPPNADNSFAGNSEKSISMKRISHDDLMTDKDIGIQDVNLSEVVLPRKPLFKSNATFNNDRKRALYAGAISCDKSEPAEFFPPSNASLSKRRISHEDFTTDKDIDIQDVDNGKCDTFNISENMNYDKFKQLASSTVIGTDLVTTPANVKNVRMSRLTSNVDKSKNNENILSENVENTSERKRNMEKSPEDVRKLKLRKTDDNTILNPELVKNNVTDFTRDQSLKNNSDILNLKSQENSKDNDNLMNVSEIERVIIDEMKAKRTNPPVRRSTIIMIPKQTDSSQIENSFEDNNVEGDINNVEHLYPNRHSNIPLGIHSAWAHNENDSQHIDNNEKPIDTADLNDHVSNKLATGENTIDNDKSINNKMNQSIDKLNSELNVVKENHNVNVSSTQHHPAESDVSVNRVQLPTIISENEIENVSRNDEVIKNNTDNLSTNVVIEENEIVSSNDKTKKSDTAVDSEKENVFSVDKSGLLASNNDHIISSNAVSNEDQIEEYHKDQHENNDTIVRNKSEYVLNVENENIAVIEPERDLNINTNKNTELAELNNESLETSEKESNTEENINNVIKFLALEMDTNKTDVNTVQANKFETSTNMDQNNKHKSLIENAVTLNSVNEKTQYDNNDRTQNDTCTNVENLMVTEGESNFILEYHTDEVGSIDENSSNNDEADVDADELGPNITSKTVIDMETTLINSGDNINTENISLNPSTVQSEASVNQSTQSKKILTENNTADVSQEHNTTENLDSFSIDSLDSSVLDVNNKRAESTKINISLNKTVAGQSSQRPMQNIPFFRNNKNSEELLEKFSRVNWFMNTPVRRELVDVNSTTADASSTDSQKVNDEKIILRRNVPDPEELKIFIQKQKDEQEKREERIESMLKVFEMRKKFAHSLVNKITENKIKKQGKGNVKNKENKAKHVKKIPVAEISDDIVQMKAYKPPKLYMKENWITNRLYTVVQRKLEDKYNIRSRNRSEKFIKDLASIVNVVIKTEKDYHPYVLTLKNEMARLKLVETHSDFHRFVIDYLPFHFRIKAIPAFGRDVPELTESLFDPIRKKKL